MKGKELRLIRDRLKWTQMELAKAVGITSNTIARYERDELSIPEPTARLVRSIAATEKVKVK
jgi:transcriptional regulator with XRE-family HTH domain